MHRAAEYGGAAHWDYKQGYQERLLLDSPTATALPEAPGYVEALNAAQKTIKENNVFVFFVGDDTSLGGSRLLSLPVGSSICDAVKHLTDFVPNGHDPEATTTTTTEKTRTVPDCTDRVEPEFHVLRNGLAAQAGDILQNGDVLLVKEDKV